MWVWASLVQMKPLRVGRWVAVFTVLAGTGVVGLVWGLSAAAAPLSSAASLHGATNLAQTAQTTSENLPQMKVDGVAAKTVTLQSANSYTPHAAAGTYDDYHCTLVNPHITSNSFIVASQFYPESKEIHHSILFLVPPALAAQAETADHNGKGWSCFGEAPIPGSSALGFSNTPWLAAWAPGAPENVEPAGTGVPLPAGSLVIEQIHYNLLIGNKPVRAKLQLQTVPATVPLKPLNIGLYVAPPDIPCPAGVTGKLCNRNASLAYSAKEFGHSLITLVNAMEAFCGRNPQDPPAGDTTSCVWPAGQTGYIVRMTAHMHLLGVSMKVTLNPGTPQAKVLLNVPNYDFNYQRSYNLAKPVYVTASDKIQVSCTYNPKLRQEIPYTRDLAPQYITWGWGSADEMCLAIAAFAPGS
jgi:Copper type II ascorbate-dependent monooxygenase, C-terminal domain